MGRGHRGSRSDSELDEMQRFKLENQKLKKQIAKLRKELSRIDIDRYSNLKDMLEAQAAEDSNFDGVFELEKLKKKWNCNSCDKDYLRLIMVPRFDGLFYMRKCPSCEYRTKLKKYSDGVDGLDSAGQPVEVLKIPIR